ncbi:uncharacterized protein LOC130777570 [Actinidia eriantha]|uniref:uncharacterized protein LOC130777570 n=1 Tax=Actinidia eriantha TaxID=165200 RepID=UPI0025897CAC|nr:uncharacterized protein LOC130777570 [Actinidia eriantha]
MAKKASKETNLIIRCIKEPGKFLVKARDMYVEAMLGCSSVRGCTVMGCPTPQFSTLRVNSLKSRNDQGLRAAKEIIGRQQSQTLGVTVVPWSQSMGMGRIDEERSCEFGDDDVKLKTDHVYSRTRSCAVPKRAEMF